MHLVVHQVVQLQEVHNAHGDRILEVVAGTAVPQAELTVDEQLPVFLVQVKPQGMTVVEVILRHVRIVGILGIGHGVGSLVQALTDFIVGSTVEHRGGNVPAQGTAGQTQVHFQHLTQIHTARHAQRIQHDLQGSTVGQERHVLFTEDPGHNTLVAVTACHLIAHGNLPLLCQVDTNHLIHAGGHFVLVFAGEDLHVHHDAALTVGHTQGGVADFTSLFAEDGAEQTLFSRQFRLTLGGYLTHQNVAGLDLGADADDTALVQILYRIIADVGNVTGDFFRSQLGFTSFGLEFFNVNGGVNVLLHQLLTQQHGVFVVVAFPGHEADQSVAAQTDFTLLRGRTVCQQVALFDLLTGGNNGALVNAGALVGSGELGQVIGVALAKLVLNDHAVAADLVHHAAFLGQDAHAGVMGGTVFHAGGHQRGFRHQQRHSLTLHVGTHQSTGSVVVFQEGNHGGCHGNHLTGTYVDVVNLLGGNFNNVGLVTNHDPGIAESAVLVQRFVGGGDLVEVFLIGRHVVDFIGHAAVVHLPVRSFDKAVLVDPSVGCQRTDQTDVGTFRGLNGADTGIVAVVHVTNFEGSTVTVQTAGAQGAQTALVGQLSQRVGLIHELAQLGRTEELLDGSADGTDVDQVAGLHVHGILGVHPLTNHTIQTAHADTDLVLQQFAYGTDTAIAQMVNVVRGAQAIGETQHVADAGYNIVCQDVLGHQAGHVLPHGFHQLIRLHRGNDLPQGGQVNHFQNAGFLGVEGQVGGGVNKVVTDNLANRAFNFHPHHVHAGVLHIAGSFKLNQVALLDHDLAVLGIHNILGSHVTVDSGSDGQFLIKLVTPYAHQVVTLGIVEQAVEQVGGAFQTGRFAGLLTLVDFDEAFLTALGIVTLGNGSLKTLVVTQQLQNFGIRAVAQCTEQHRQGQLPGTVNTHPQHVVGVGFVLQPGAPVGNDLGRIQRLAGLVQCAVKIDAGRTNQLRHDDALTAVNDKGAMVGHQREIAHEHIRFFNFTGFPVLQADKDLQRCGVGLVTFTAFLQRILRLLQCIIHELEHQITIIVSNR